MSMGGALGRLTPQRHGPGRFWLIPEGQGLGNGSGIP